MRSPETVTISMEPAAIATTGCNVIVTATPVSDAKYFDKVIWKQMHALAEKKVMKQYKKKQIIANPRGLLKPKLCPKSAGNIMPL